MRLIDADALKKEIFEHCRSEKECLNHFWFDENLILLVDNAPTVSKKELQKIFYETAEKPELKEVIAYECGKASAEREQGEWIIVKDERYGDNVKCPFCEKELAGTDLNYCCKCGAKLSGSEKMNDDQI